MNHNFGNRSKCDATNIRRTVIETRNGITVIDVSPPSIPLPYASVATHAIPEHGHGFPRSNYTHSGQAPPNEDASNRESTAQFYPPSIFSSTRNVGPFDAPAQRSPDLPPPSVSQYSTSKNTVTNLQMERRMLQPRLSFLQKHLVLHKLHIRHARRTEETKRITNSYRERLGLIGERRESLVAAHSASVRGSYAKEYRKLLAKHVRLEDQFRQAVSSRVVALYALQKLIIDVVYSHTTGRPWMSPVSMKETATERGCIPNVPTIRPQAAVDHPSAQVREATNAAYNLEPIAQPAGIPVPPSDPESQVSASSAGITSTLTSSRLADFIAHVLEILPPPDLSYPSDDLGFDQPILMLETGFARTQIAEDGPVEPQVTNGELASFLTIVNRFIPERGNRRFCSMCGNAVQVTSIVGFNDLQVMLEHLKRVHPRSRGPV